MASAANMDLSAILGLWYAAFLANQSSSGRLLFGTLLQSLKETTSVGK
jgi:MFS-type transporter involved in bile tolerance (Atg22 family)